jgi:hypothetical protein
VLDISALSLGTLESLAKVFDEYADKALKRIPKQFDPNDPDPVRLGIDKDFIKTLFPAIDDEVLEGKLKRLYRHVDVALKQWITGTRTRSLLEFNGNLEKGRML